MDLRTRYTALVTLITQYVKFASETLKRAEDEEVREADFKASLSFHTQGADAANNFLLHCSSYILCFVASL